MLLEDVEKFTQVVNLPDTMIVDEATGDFISKEDIAHFVILYDRSPEQYTGIKPKRKRRTKKELTEQETEPELIDEGLNRDETAIVLDRTKVLSIIAKRLKISEYSSTVLSNNGWWVCPVIEGMMELRPIIVESVKNGFVLITKEEPLMKFDKSIFDNESKYRWDNNSIPLMVEEMMSDLSSRFIPKSVFRHKKDRYGSADLKSVVNQVELAQKTRIKVGSIVLNNVYTHLGKRLFRQNKEDLAKQKAKSAEDIAGEVKTDDVKMIKIIVDEYNTVKRIAESRNDKLRNNDDFKPYVSDYIPSFSMYSTIGLYLKYVEIEQEVTDLMKGLVRLQPLWQNYLVGIKGVGEVSAAHIIANFDIYNTNHPSSFIKYVGLDQIIINPERDEEDQFNDEEVVKMVKLLFRDYQLINERAKRFEDEISEFSFNNYTTDSVKHYDEYSAIQKWYIEYKNECDEERERETSNQIFDLNAIDIILPEIKRDANFYLYLKRLWERYDVFEVEQEEIVDVPVIRRRARHKGDKDITTYLAKNGEVKTKLCLGYNPSLKGRLLGVLFPSFLKARGSGYGALYYEYKERLLQRPDIAEKIAAGKPVHVHSMARRRTMQIFIEDLWKAWRTLEGLPLNGGTYAEGKLGIFHRQGASPELLRTPVKDKAKVTSAY